MIPEYFSEGQKNAIEQFMIFYKNSSKGFIYQIDGAAGTGKTELTKYILNQIPDTIVCASTNKACQVLTERLPESNIVTCHIFLNGVLKYTRDGKQTWFFNLNNVTIPNLIILDEVSMVDHIVFKQYKNLVERKQARILTLGDRCQLPPVEEDVTSFYEYYPIHTSLKNNMRNMDKAYNIMLGKIRKKILSTDQVHISGPSIVYWLAKYTPTYTLQTFINIEDIPIDIFNAYRQNKDAIFLAHRTNRRNNTVHQLNLKIRNMMFNYPREKYMVGDKIIFTDYFDQYHTNDLSEITHIQFGSETFYKTEYKIFKLTLIDGNTINTIHPDDNKRFEKDSCQIKHDIINRLEPVTDAQVDELWKEYNAAYKHISAPIDYAYALSIHKSQGSTYRQTFLYLSDFIWMLDQPTTTKQFFKLLYVGLSRTQTNTIIF